MGGVSVGSRFIGRVGRRRYRLLSREVGSEDGFEGVVVFAFDAGAGVGSEFGGVVICIDIIENLYYNQDSRILIW